MSAHSIKELIKLWAAERITQERIIGQILLLLQGLQQQIYELEKRVARSERATQSPERSGRGEARGGARDAPDV
jgi:hypothetical protein